MANIKTHLNNIKGALYGKDVRGSIHDGIDAINKEVENTTGRQVDLENTFDQLVINAGNSNAEIVDARVKSDGTSYSKLGDRLDVIDSQLAQKETKTTLEIHSANMTGTGDCMVLKTKNGTTILCDTGSSNKWSEVDAFLSKNIDKLDYIIITHYHGDHVGNLENILKKYKSDNCIAILPCEPDFLKMNVNGTQIEIETQRTYSICDVYRVTRKIPNEGEVLEIDDIKLKFMNCSLDMFTDYYNEVSEFATNNETDYNNFSLVFEVIHNKNKILFTSDINVKAQEKLLPYLQKYDLLKCPHHSVDTFFHAPFMLKTSPNMAFSNNSGQSSLAKSEITRYFISRGIPYYVTCKSGDLSLISDGFKITTNNITYFTGMSNKDIMSSLGVNNFTYFGFGEIVDRYNDDPNSITLVDAIKEMSLGSLATVNFVYGYDITPDFVSSYSGGGFIQKISDNKATIILFDNNPNVFNCYIGLWHSSITEVIWHKLGSDERIEKLNKKVNVTLYNTYSSMSDLGITTSSTALEMVKAMPHSSLYSGFVSQYFDDKLDVYGAMVDIKKSTNNLIAKITMTSANPKNMIMYEGIYHQNVGDYITWKKINLETV